MHPFGTSAYRTAKSNTDLSLKRYRFTNKERDDETGLYYFGVRYYAAWLGRWTSSDPGGFVDGLNLYQYAQNNPVKLVDADGYKAVNPENREDGGQKGGEAILDENGDKVLDSEGNPLLAGGDGVATTTDDGFEPPHGFKKYESIVNDDGIYLPPGVTPTLNSENKVTFFNIEGKFFYPYKDKEGNVEGYRAGVNGIIYDPNPQIKIEFNKTTRPGMFYRHDGFFKAKGLPIEELQIIQIVFASQEYPAAKERSIRDRGASYLGTNDYRLTLVWDNKEFLESEGLVDGGKYSPYVLESQNGEEAYPGKPFYPLDPRAMAWDSDNSSGYVAFNDTPSAGYSRPLLRFGVFVVGRNYMGTKKDIILGAYSWGIYKGKPIQKGGENSFDANSDLIPEMLKIIKNDYPDYQIFGN